MAGRGRKAGGSLPMRVAWFFICAVIIYAIYLELRSGSTNIIDEANAASDWLKALVYDLIIAFRIPH